MKLVLLRHEIAAPREPGAAVETDAKRPLTDEGRKRARRAARGLHRLLGGIDRLASSPLRRARETAEAVAAEFDGLEIDEQATFAPGQTPQAQAGWLSDLDRGWTVAVVGHEPGLSGLATWLVSGLSRPVLELGKGGACLIELDGRVAPGEGRLAWLLRPGQLRRLR